jgi:hypothetical protein
MTYPAPFQATDRMLDMSEVTLLSALKLQLEGLAVLFGGALQEEASSDLAQDGEMQKGFDNLPV